MQRYLDDPIARDLKRKLVFVTGPRQVGKTTLSRLLLKAGSQGVYLNHDIARDRVQIERQSWQPDAALLVLDELHKMPNWKNWLKGVVDGKPDGQQILVTGSARMDTFRQTGESLAGRFLSWRLHPISVREWCDFGATPVDLAAGDTAEKALTKLLVRGGFPEPFLADSDVDAQRWRMRYADGLVREDVLEFSRIQELGSMRVLLDLLRDRVGSPLSLASLARDLQLSQPTVKRYLDILQALYIIFLVQPWHHHIARSLQQAPKVYFYDTGMVGTQSLEESSANEQQTLMGARFENATALMLLKNTHYQQDAYGKPAGLHYLRTKDGAEIDFALSVGIKLTHMIECKLSDAAPAKAFSTFGTQWPVAKAIQVVRHLPKAEHYKGVDIVNAAQFFAAFEV
jgi:predicted AAA+ superfamily ATPase